MLVHHSLQASGCFSLLRQEGELAINNTITNIYNYNGLHAQLHLSYSCSCSYLSFAKQRLAFVPPKPKLFEMATLTVFCWATLGT